MNKAYYANKGLFVGIAAIVCAFYFFAPTLFTFKSALMEQTGDIDFINITYTPVESSRGTKSFKSELKFTLNSTNNTYVLMKNIGYSRHNERFEKLKNQLKKSETVTVWIKQSEKTKYRPTVYQIADNNKQRLYDFHESKSKARFGFLISFSFGLFGIGLFLKHKYSIRLRKLFKF